MVTQVNAFVMSISVGGTPSTYNVMHHTDNERLVLMKYSKHMNTQRLPLVVP